MDMSVFNVIYSTNAHLLKPAYDLLDVFKVLEKREIDFSKLIELLNRDQKLAGRILKFSNSFFFRSRLKIQSVGDAIGALGIDNMKELVYAALCCNFFNRQESREWQHAYTTSLLVTEIAKSYGLTPNHDLQLLALLHDIGKVALRRSCQRQYKMINKGLIVGNAMLFEQERDFFQIDHSDIGALLLDNWKLPDRITEPVFFHHMEDLPDRFREETVILRFADWIDNRIRKQFLPGPFIGDISLSVTLLDDIQHWLDYQESIIDSMEAAGVIQASVA